MLPFTIPLAPILGAGAAIAGSLIGGKMSADATSAANENNAALQREFAQHGLSWRVADARRAGIHPLAALGANIQGASPSYVVGDSSHPAQMGQDISRAVTASWSPSERAQGMASFAGLQARNLKLQGDLLAEQIAASKAARLNTGGPGVPIGPDTQLVRDPAGKVYSVPSEAFAQASQGMMMPGIEWYWRNRLINPLMDAVSRMSERRAYREYAPEFRRQRENEEFARRHSLHLLHPY